MMTLFYVDIQANYNQTVKTEVITSNRLLGAAVERIDFP